MLRFALFCPLFLRAHEGYPFTQGLTSSLRHQDSNDAMDRPSSDLRRLDSQRQFYSDNTSFASDASSTCYPAFGREAPDGQSLDLSRMHSGVSLMGKRQPAVLSQKGSASSNTSCTPIGLPPVPDTAAASPPSMDSFPPPPPELDYDLDTVEEQRIEQRGRIAPAPSMNFVGGDHPRGFPKEDSDIMHIPVMSPHNPSVPEVISLVGQPRRGTPHVSHDKHATGSPRSMSPQAKLSLLHDGNGFVGPRTTGRRSSSSSNLYTAQDSDSNQDLRVGVLSKGMSDMSLQSRICSSPTSSQTRLPSSNQSLDDTAPGQPERRVEYNRCSSMPAQPAAFSPDRRHSTPDGFVARRFTSASHKVQVIPPSLVRQLAAQSSQTAASERNIHSQPPFMSSTADVSAPTTTAPPPSSRTGTLPRQPARQERLNSQDSAIGCSSSEDLLADPVSRTTSSRPINTQLVVKKNFQAKGDNQLTVSAGEVVVVADERDHKDWLWVFAPMQRAFGFVPVVYTKNRQ